MKKLKKVKLPKQKAKEITIQIKQPPPPKNPSRQLTEAQQLSRDADIRAANKAAWSQLERKPNLLTTQE